VVKDVSTWENMYPPPHQNTIKIETKEELKKLRLT
jgi:hypothetical protein